MAEGPSLAAYGDLLNNGGSLSSDDVTVLAGLLSLLSPGRWPADSGVAATTLAVVNSLEAAEQYRALVTILPEAWRIARDLGDEKLIIALSRIMKDQQGKEQYSLVASIAGSGLGIANAALSAGQRQELDTALSGALAVAGPSLALPKTDPRYPVLVAQKNWQIGRTTGAWNEYSAAGTQEMVQTMVGELNIDFVLWLVGEHIRREQYDLADGLNRSLITWIDSLDVPIAAEKRAEILLSRGITDLKRKNYPVARSQFRFIAEGEDFANTRQSIRANLLTAEVDRLTGRADEAHQVLTRMARSRDSYTQGAVVICASSIKS